MKVTAMLKQSFILLAGVLAILPYLVSGKAKHVAVSLEGKWQDTPMCAEASEYLAKENKEVFWDWVEHLGQFEERHIHAGSQEEHYQFITKSAENFLPTKQLQLFHFAMSIRAHSPVVEMYSQLARDLPLPDCPAFYDIHGFRSCDLQDLDNLIKKAKGRPTGLLLERDHVYPKHGSAKGAAKSDHDGSVTVILYGELGRDAFQHLHQMLKFYADKGKIKYIVRHYFKPEGMDQVRLSGYGVELAIKSQEYKAQDDTKIHDEKESEDEGPDEVQGFVFSTLKKLHPEQAEDLKKFKEHLIAGTNEVPTLKVWQLQDLSFQAASKILSMARADQLTTLRDVSQNFPLLSGQLVKTTVPSELRKEIRRNQMLLERRYGLNAGDSALFLNGLQLDLDIHDAFTLVETLSAEVRLLAGLSSLGLSGARLNEVLQIDVREQESAYALDIRDKSVVYVNDLEKDRRYSNWPRNLEDLLKPTFPGMLRHMARNMFHLIFVVDPAQKGSVELLRMAEAFYVHNAPIRIGLLLVVNDAEVADGDEDLGVALYRGFQYVAARENYGKALSFLTDVYDKTATHGWDVETVRSVLAESASSSKIDDILSTDKYDKGRLDSVDYFVRTGLTTLPQVLMNGQPLKPEQLSQDAFEEAVVGAIMKATPDLQRAVYNNELTNSMSVVDWLMKRPNVMPRLNQRVFATDNKYVSFTVKHNNVSVEKSVEFLKLSSQQMTANLFQGVKYLTKNEESSVRPVTISVVADYETSSGRLLLMNALKHLKSSNQVRLGVVYNHGGPVDQTQTTFWSRLIRAALKTLPNNVAKQFLLKILKSERHADIAAGKVQLEEFEIHGMDMSAFKKAMDTAGADFIISHKAFTGQILSLKAGQRAIVVNGRVVGPFDADEVFSHDDFGVLEKHALTTVAEKVEEVVSHMDLDEDESSELIMKIAAQVLGNPQSSSARKVLSGLDDVHSAVRIMPEKKESPFEIVAILDPLTRDAQRIAPLIIVLKELLDAKVTIYMNCKEKLSEMPLKNFYRYVLEARPRFDGGRLRAPGARFTALPHALILTLNVDPPQGWLVGAIKTPYDLDNIKLQEIGGSVTAWYELENLLLEGHCFDTTSGGAPPRGLQFTLGTSNKPVMVDTIVMANLGYFQLKANPGAWLLRLRDGKSKEIYDIAGHDFTDSSTEHDDVIIVMDTFKSKIIKVKVAKKPDKLKEDVLDSSKSDDNSGGGIWDSISSKSHVQSLYQWLIDYLPVQLISSFTGKKAKPEHAEPKDETINIFSVASGHLYERFLRIMTLGVMKHTKSKVKFWFLKNYLSPTFKDTIGVLAKHYGFEYELVQYKWPRWLHQQTEKQRIIWGYKILFLDVLFPLDVKKIIFVDADQIVRADLQELNDLDLEGAPYGYTPFCDSRTEMEGFRFWKTGYWASHLGHRKYHISALYVVDLVKFRRIAAGDRLRGQYQGLSQDPNSLSNLDQDLPNNMIHQVAIKSLPMEWLWCETWCSDREKKYAKTIDMCNNPQTKEPKLTAARRIAPEWTEYDNEIRQLLDKKHHSIKTVHKESKDAKTAEQETYRDEL